MHGAVAAAHREVRWQVLLDGDEMIQIRIPGKIGDAESPLPDHGTDLVPMDLVSHWKSNLGAVGDGQGFGLGLKTGR